MFFESVQTYLSTDMNSDYPLTLNEAKRFLLTNELPEDFRKRVEVFFQSADCSNCEGTKDMNVVLRQWFEDEPSLCPFCDQLTPEEEKGFPRPIPARLSVTGEAQSSPEKVFTYKDAGVDRDAAERAVELIRRRVNPPDSITSPYEVGWCSS